MNNYINEYIVNLKIIRSLHKLKIILTLLVITIAMTIYSGYFFGIESLYRPIENGSATHELTLISVLLLSGVVLLEQVNLSALWPRMLAGLAALISLTRLTEILFDYTHISSITPYHEIAETAISNGLSHSMGMNTSLAVAFISIAILARRKAPRLSFLIGSGAPFLAFSSLAGYGFGENELHGAMSFVTILLLLPLSLASMMYWAHYKFLRGMFLQTQMGRIARIQVLLSLSVPWLLGAIIIHISKVQEVYPFALYTTTVSWFIIGIILLGAFLHEGLDSLRRAHERKIYRLSTTDNLTGCNTRHEGIAQGKRAIKLAARGKARLSVLMFDVDNFKNINDTYGHMEGDNVLRVIAGKIKETLRSTDILIRWGGEEFVTILYDCSNQDALNCAEKIRKSVENTIFPLEGESNFNVTVSIGCSSYTQANDEFLNLVDHADIAMYKAKHTGKNKAIEYTDDLMAAALA